MTGISHNEEGLRIALAGLSPYFLESFQEGMSPSLGNMVSNMMKGMFGIKSGELRVALAGLKSYLLAG